MDGQSRKSARICEQSELDPVRYGGCTAWERASGKQRRNVGVRRQLPGRGRAHQRSEHPAGFSGSTRCRCRVLVPSPAASRRITI